MQGKGFYITVNGDATYHTFAHIRNAIEDGGFNAQIIDSSQDMSMISIQGPNRWQSCFDSFLSGGYSISGEIR